MADETDRQVRIEKVARAIYMAHWRPSGLDERCPPVWENASEAVQDWVRVQAAAALETIETVVLVA